MNCKTLLLSGLHLTPRQDPRPEGVWMSRSKAIRSLDCRTGLKQKSIVTEIRVGLAVSHECEKDEPVLVEAFDVVRKIDDLTAYIQEFLRSIEDGRISLSAYDTAWVALIKNVNEQEIPQFPCTLEWIARNQIRDGSWGDNEYFNIYDRLLNTLACVVALRSWNVHHDKTEKGIRFIEENICKLEYAADEHMTCGFEVVFPALLKRARDMAVPGLSYDHPALSRIYAARKQKMTRIPKEMMHTVQSTLLFSLEGLEDLEWEKLLKLQSYDGSFLISPSSTAYAFMETKDENCLRYITNLVEKFSGGVPNVYPVDIFSRLWAVDRLNRLGISRFFEMEIKECVKYVYRFWNEKGLYSGGTCKFTDIDLTSMGFMFLRLHGFNVTPDVLNNFRNENGFTCFPGQTFESTSPIFNLYRASQLLFPGEQILEEANYFSKTFLQEKINNNQLLDKWLISHHFPDEIRAGLAIPWYASLPRVEARFYIENYGGAKHIWTGKSLYRMPDIDNDAYLELTKLDFNRCQAQHQIEWNNIQEWYVKCKLQELEISRKDLLFAFFLATASIFEPERWEERKVWIKYQVISKIITYYYRETTFSDEKIAFLADTNGLNQTLEELLQGLDASLCHQLGNAPGTWLMKLRKGVINREEKAEILVTALNVCAGRIQSVEILSHHEYKTLSKLTNRICYKLSQYQNQKVSGKDSYINVENGRIKYMEIEKDMQKLVQLVLEEPSGISMEIRQTFLLVAKANYYAAYFSAETIETHISKVLFEPVP